MSPSAENFILNKWVYFLGTLTMNLNMWMCTFLEQYFKNENIMYKHATNMIKKNTFVLK